MNKQEYLDLIKCGFLSNGGTVERYWSKDDRPFDMSKVNKNLLKDLDTKLDYNNLIILFPVSFKYSSTTCLFGTDHNNSFPIDHCTYIIDIRSFLDKKGIKYRDNIKMTDSKYGQYIVSMLIIQDGIAYAHNDNVNPFGTSLSYHSSDFALEIKIRSEDTHLNFDNKNIIFSGFLVNKIRNKTV